MEVGGCGVEVGSSGVAVGGTMMMGVAVGKTNGVAVGKTKGVAVGKRGVGEKKKNWVGVG